jgi:hypothetical protein
MRTLVATLLIFASGCGRTSDTSLYSDEFVRDLARFDIDNATAAASSFFDIPVVEGVPLGRSASRDEVFKSLGIEVKRLRNFRWDPRDRGAFLIWQISPSYDIVLSTVESADANTEDSIADPGRHISDVRFVSRDRTFAMWDP